MKKITVLIIDDERNARAELRRLLARYPDFEIIGEAKDAEEAKAMIEDRSPDLLFLDIQLPEKSGFELLESLLLVPEVIFVTAFDQYALQAFEVSALDYLMKPVREERFARAIDQVRTKPSATEGGSIFVKDRNQYHFIRWNQVFLIESMDNYAQLHVDDKKVLLKTSLKQLEDRLDETRFFRANRAQIINLGFIDKMGITPGGKAQVCLKTGDIIEISERQWVKFKNRMGGR